MEALQVVAVGTGTHIEAVDPRTADQFDKVLVAFIVFGQHNEVPSALVALVGLAHLLLAVGHIHFATENGLEGFQSFLLALSVHLVAIVEQFLHAEHIAVVGESHAAHAVANGFVHKFLDARLSVENAIIGVYVKVYEVFHVILMPVFQN